MRYAEMICARCSAAFEGSRNGHPKYCPPCRYTAQLENMDRYYERIKADSPNYPAYLVTKAKHNRAWRARRVVDPPAKAAAP